MKISFVAGFGPIVRDMGQSRAFWERDLGIAFEEVDPGYFSKDDLAGVNTFALWPLTQAAEATFGTDKWPDDLPVPTTWLEFDVESPEAVGEAIAELAAAGHRILSRPKVEPWGQTTSRLMSPEGILVGVAYTPSMHEPHPDEPATAS